MQNTLSTTDKSLFLPWEFVRKFYPNFEQSEEIKHEENLNKILDGEYDDGDEAETLLHAFYEDDSDNPQLLIDRLNALVTIYETAMENMLTTGEFVPFRDGGGNFPEDLKPEAAAAYLANPRSCPFCGSANLDATSEDSISEAGRIYQRVDCSDCQKNWYDEYVLAGVKVR
jgi:hypothetical protein